MDPQQQSPYTFPTLTQQSGESQRQGIDQILLLLEKAERGYASGESQIGVSDLKQLDQLSRQVRGRGFGGQKGGGGIKEFGIGFVNSLAMGAPEAMGIFDPATTVSQQKSRRYGDIAGMVLPALFGAGALVSGVRAAGRGGTGFLAQQAAKMATKKVTKEEGATLLSGYAQKAKAAARPMAVSAGLSALGGASAAARDEFGNYNSAEDIIQGAGGGALLGAGIGAVGGGLLRMLGKNTADATRAARALAPGKTTSTVKKVAGKVAGSVSDDAAKVVNNSVNASVDDIAKATDNLSARDAEFLRKQGYAIGNPKTPGSTLVNSADDAVYSGGSQSVIESATDDVLRQGRSFRDTMDNGVYGKRVIPAMKSRGSAFTEKFDDDVFRYSNSEDGSRKGIFNFFQRGSDDEVSEFVNEYTRVKSSSTKSGRDVQAVIKKFSNRGEDLRSTASAAQRTAEQLAASANKEAAASASNLGAYRVRARQEFMDSEGLKAKDLLKNTAAVKRSKEWTNLIDDVIASDGENVAKQKLISGLLDEVKQLPKGQQLARIKKLRLELRTGNTPKSVSSAANDVLDELDGSLSNVGDMIEEGAEIDSFTLPPEDSFRTDVYDAS
tara:strand:+ start:8599 stop:10428 length:1830 start_codon:yes stop_codon:yes gene_type:complete